MKRQTSPPDGQEEESRFEQLLYFGSHLHMFLNKRFDVQLVRTYQNIFQFYVSVHESLAVQEANPLHHVQSDLKPLPQR